MIKNLTTLSKEQRKALTINVMYDKNDKEYFNNPFWYSPMMPDENIPGNMICETLSASDLPCEKDYKKGGLQKTKYIIKKADGEAVDPEAWYFVLRIDTDPHAQAAAMEYCKSVKRQNPQLARELMNAVMNYRPDDMKISEEWYSYYHMNITDPDGWDRRNFTFEWFEDKISWKEFCRRAEMSTLVPLSEPV